MSDVDVIIITADGAYQGDLGIWPITDPLPTRLAEVPAVGVGHHIVAHSETGHHHVAEPGPGSEVRYLRPADDTGPEAGLVAYLEVLRGHADVVHHRAWDTHQTIRLPVGTYMLRRQREHSPDGWRMVVD